MENCPGKVVPYSATVSYQFKNVDLGLDVFTSLSKHEQGGSEGVSFYTTKIKSREVFVFRVK